MRLTQTPWLLLVLASLRHQAIVSALINQDQARAFITLVIQQTPSSWVHVTPPPHCALLLDTLCNPSAIPAVRASTILWATLAGVLALALIASSMSSKMFSKSTTLFRLARKMSSVKTASTGNSSKATAVTRPQARPASRRAPLLRLAQRLARRPAGGAVSTSPPRHRKPLPRP